MKIGLILIGFLLIIFSSCRKDKNCTCVHQRDGIDRGISEQVTDKECVDLNSKTTENDTIYTISCVEK